MLAMPAERTRVFTDRTERATRHLTPCYGMTYDVDVDQLQEPALQQVPFPNAFTLPCSPTPSLTFLIGIQTEKLKYKKIVILNGKQFSIREG